MLAKALGSRVYKGPKQEIGWYPIELTDNALKDPLMMKLASHPDSGYSWKKFMVFHWHGETFDIPEGAVRLASSELYPNQAFRYGKGAYAFQFHIEVRKEMIAEWLRDDSALSRIRKDTETFYEEYLGRAENFYFDSCYCRNGNNSKVFMRQRTRFLSIISLYSSSPYPTGLLKTRYL
jgi:hypothetical protein